MRGLHVTSAVSLPECDDDEQLQREIQMMIDAKRGDSK